MPQMVALHWPCMLCAGHACGALAMHAVHLQVAQAMLPEVAAELIDRRDTAIATKLLELSGAQGETQGPLVATVALFQMDGVVVGGRASPLLEPQQLSQQRAAEAASAGGLRRSVARLA
jgi:pheromone shutdown protein TraB